MSNDIDKIKLLMTRRMQSMKDEATARRRFTLKQQVEELESLFKMMERHYGESTHPNSNAESIGENGDTV